MKSDLHKRLDALDKLVKRQQAQQTPVVLVDYAIPPAKAFLQTKARWKAALCTRRSAKSYSSGLWLLDAIRLQQGNVLYVGMEHGQIKKDFYRACVQEIDAKYGLHLKLNESDLSAQSANGSYLYCLSMDASAAEHRKLRGGKYRKIIIDECQGFKTDLQSLIRDVLQPAVADYHGEIGLIGTPGVNKEGFWWDVTSKNIPGWHVSSWTAYENPHVEWAKEIEDLKKQTPGIEQTTSFRREYKGEWVQDDSDLLYKFDENKNVYLELPTYGRGEWHHNLGIDLGYNHPSALVAAAYHDEDPTLYFTEVQKGSGWTVTDTANRIKAMNRRRNFETMVIDPSWAQSIAELRTRHDLPVQAADKPGRDQMIELFNDQLILGRIKIGPGCEELAHEWRNVNKIDRVGDDLSDAARYLFKECYQYLSKSPKPAVKPGTAQWLKDQEDALRASVEHELAEPLPTDVPDTEWFFNNGYGAQ